MAEWPPEMPENVVPLRVQTTLDLPVDKVLCGARDAERVLVLSEVRVTNEDGSDGGVEFVMACSTADRDWTAYMLARATHDYMLICRQQDHRQVKRTS
jgi:hypothetical protein